MLEGSGVRRKGGPGTGVVVLFCLAGVCAAIAVYIRIRQTPRRDPASTFYDAAGADGEITTPDPITPQPETGSASTDTPDTGTTGNAATGTGTGSAAIGSGMGIAAIGSGTGSAAIGSGTGSATTGSGTGSATTGNPSLGSSATNMNPVTGSATPATGSATTNKAPTGSGGSGSSASPGDANVKTTNPPAGVAPGDAGAEMSPETKVQQAKLLMEKALAALEGGQFAKAIELCDQSLKLRRTARTLLLRAQALQKLDRVDDALTSVSDANLVYLQSEGRDFAAGWELKGKILWAAGRYDDARAAYQHFLEIEPNGAAAAEARRRINEPR